jgi:hypothetical protein
MKIERKANGEVFITDSSKNGTFVNATRIVAHTETPLKHGDRVEICYADETKLSYSFELSSSAHTHTPTDSTHYSAEMHVDEQQVIQAKLLQQENDALRTELEQLRREACAAQVCVPKEASASILMGSANAASCTRQHGRKRWSTETT